MVIDDSSKPKEKPLHRVASAKRDYQSFPDQVQDDMGYALGLARLGARHLNAKQRQMMSLITRGTANVFADLGYADAGERQIKTRLALAVNELLRRRGLKQREVAALLGIPQPKVSALTNYRLDNFSVERLMEFLTALDRDIEIMIRPRAGKRGVGHISVLAVS